MSVTQGKFVLCDLREFSVWLAKYQIQRKIDHLQVHHTWEPSYNDFTGKNHFELLRGMEDYQVKKEKFNQIAQNFTIFPDGMIAVCRDLNIQPAGIKGCNFDGICIECIGCFDDHGDIMTEVHKKAIIGVYALLCQKCNLTPSLGSIKYHCWFNLNTGVEDNLEDKNNDGEADKEYYPDHKTCPGSNWFGGNAPHTALANFIPLIKERMMQV